MCVSYCCLLEDERGSNDDNVEKMHSPRERQKAGSVGWHHRLYGHEFEQGLGVGDGQGGLVCCSPFVRKQLDMMSD